MNKTSTSVTCITVAFLYPSESSLHLTWILFSHNYIYLQVEDHTLHVFLADLGWAMQSPTLKVQALPLWWPVHLGFRHLNNWRVKESEISAMCMHWEGWWQSYSEDNQYIPSYDHIQGDWRACFLQPTISHSQSGVLCVIVFALQVIERALPIYCANWLTLRYSNCCQASAFLEPFGNYLLLVLLWLCI